MNASPPSSYSVLSHHTSSPAIRWEGHMCDGVGATFGPTPLAFLSATPDELLLCGNRGSFRLPLAAIRKVRSGRLYPWFFCAVRIDHTISGYPDDLQFKPMHRKPHEVREQLKALGYPVK